MIKLFSLKEEKAKEVTNGAASNPKIPPGLIRMQKDMSELKMDKGMALSLYNGPEDLMNFKITVTPDDGMYKRGVFVFDFKVPKTYPHDPPKVQCETTVFHPNIDMEGHVCLNILREDWKPVLTIQSVIMGLQFLMLEPNADDPLNKEAAAMLSDNPRRFADTVKQTFLGRTMQVAGQRFIFPKFE
jgi:ubiquitin-conjugating enzyme E2 M